MTFDASLEITRLPVAAEWIDYNGHMNVAYYVLAFDKALDRFCDTIGIGWDYVKRTRGSIFVLETHVTYLREVMQDDPLLFTLQLLDMDRKRFHYFMRMYHAEQGFLAATSEQIALHVDLSTRRSTPLPDATIDRLSSLLDAHGSLPRPEQAGHVIAIRRGSK